MITSMPEMAQMMQPFMSVPVLAQVRLAEWDSLLRLPRPKDGLFASISVWHYARALAFQARGDRAAAIQEQRGFEEMRSKVPADQPWLNNRASDVLAVGAEILGARIANSPALAVSHWQRAVELQDALVYDERPPGIIRYANRWGQSLYVEDLPRRLKQYSAKEFCGAHVMEECYLGSWKVCGTRARATRPSWCAVSSKRLGRKPR
jgi:hypothetical protein